MDRPEQHQLRLAHCLYPEAISIRHYIDLLNETLKPQPIFHLEDSSVCSKATAPFWPSYLRLLDNLIVAFPHTSTATFPTDVTLTPTPWGISAVNMDNVVNTAINSVLEKDPDAWRTNALCAGIFRNRFQRYSGNDRYAGLSVKSPSGSLQVLHSSAWQLLLTQLGPKILVHLLCKTTLLLTVGSLPQEPCDRQARSNVVWRYGFLQISGPCTNALPRPSMRSRSTRSESVVSFRHDVVRRTPRFRRPSRAPVSPLEGFVIFVQRKAPARNPRKHPVSCLEMNPGLPTTHHLNRLLTAKAPFEVLIPIIFRQYIPDSLRFKRGRSNSAHIWTPHIYNYDATAACFVTTARSLKRSADWSLLITKVPKRLKRLVTILNKVQVRLQQHNIRRILGIACPLPASILSSRDQPVPRLHSLLELYCHPKAVAHFLVKACRVIFSTDLFGSGDNLHKFEASIHSFVQRRRHKESFDIGSYFSERALAVTEIGWLNTLKGNSRRVSGPSDLLFRQKQLGGMLTWLYRGFVIPLLEQNFFVTEGNHHKHRLFFYRREVWSLILDYGYKELLRQSRRFSVLSKGEALEAHTRRYNYLRTLNQPVTEFPALYYHELRFLSKGKDVRVIQRPRVRPLLLHKELSVFEKTKWCQSISKTRRRTPGVMKNILSVLRAELKSRPSLGGAAVLTSGAIHEKWLGLKEAWIAEGKPRMYACCVDIARSFDTVPLRTLIEDVLPPVLSKERYPLVKMWVSKRDRLTEQIRYRKLIHACLDSGEEVSFRRLLREKMCRLHPGSVFTDSSESGILRRSEILNILDEFLTNNLVWVPRRNRKQGESSFALQKQGLPQGHTLSPILTTLFYGYMEQQDLKGFLSMEVEKNRQMQTSLLMRFVDDTMFITSRAEFAQQFLARMVQGWKLSHGVTVNTEKIQANFSSGVGRMDNIRWLAWCGHLVDSQTLEIRGDYSKYLTKGSRLRDSVTVDLGRECVQRWMDRSASCFLPKISKLLIDGRINGAFTVALNVYQAAILVSLKNIAYMTAIGNFHHAYVINRVISHTVEQFIKLVGIVGGHAYKVTTGNTRNFFMPLTQSELTFLTVHAFHETFIRKAVHRKGSCRHLKSGILMCTDSLQLQLHTTLANLRVSRPWCIPQVADRIASKQCDVLWSILL